VGDAPRDLAALGLADFAACVGERFGVQVDGRSLELALLEAEALAPAAPRPGGRRPFSLVFRGPRAPVLPQRVYRLESARLGALEIFLVPIGPDDAGLRYEAIFA
jgi:hypothetical protein